MVTNSVKSLFLVFTLILCYFSLFLIAGGKISAALHFVAFLWVHIPILIFLLFKLGLTGTIHFFKRVGSRQLIKNDTATADRIISLTFLSGFLFSGYGLIASFIALNKIEDVGSGFSAMIHGPLCGALLPLFFTLLEISSPIRTSLKTIAAIAYFVPMISLTHYAIINLTN